MLAAPEVKKSLTVLMFQLFVTCAPPNVRTRGPSIEPGTFEVIEVVP